MYKPVSRAVCRRGSSHSAENLLVANEAAALCTPHVVVVQTGGRSNSHKTDCAKTAKSSSSLSTENLSVAAGPSRGQEFLHHHY